MKTAFVCPGQGSQTPGMGKEFPEYNPSVLEAFVLGEFVTGRNLSDLCIDADAETLNRTENAQLAIFTVTMSYFAMLQKKGIVPDAVAGFSLGECSALCMAGVVSLSDGFQLVAERGKLMQQAADAGNGRMSAVLVLEAERIEALSEGLDAQPVNYNCPGQTVIAGTPEGVDALTLRCKEAGAKRVIPLALSGAFHTKAMAPAAETLEAYARTITYEQPKTPVYTNLTGKPLDESFSLPEHLSAQMQSPVRWQLSVENMIRDGYTRFIEVGPGNTLSRFIQKIDRSAEVLPLRTLL